MKRLVALVLALMMLSCVALGEGEGLHYLTKEDIAQIYNPDALASYQDDTMAEPVVSGTAEELALTDEEIEQIRAMDLTICLQQDHLDDAMKLIQQAFQDACDELGITLGSIWMAADQSGAAARSDYENFLSVTDEYDAFFTCLSDASLNTDILKEIMEEIHTADVCQLQQFADLLPPRFFFWCAIPSCHDLCTFSVLFLFYTALSVNMLALFQIWQRFSTRPMAF